MVIWGIAILVIASLGFGLFAQTREQVMDRQYRLLGALADVHAREIAAWQQERIADLKWLAEGFPNHQALVDALRTGSPPSAQLSRSIDEIVARHGYESVFVADAAGRVRYFTGHPPAFEDRDLPRLIAEVSGGAGAATFDITRQEDQAPRVVVLFPLIDRQQSVGVVGLQVDPHATGVPIVTIFPLADSSAEILVFRRNGELITYLTGPRFASGAEASYSVRPTSRLLAEQVLRGRHRVEGVDYRGAPAIGVGRPIEGTPWHLIAKLDKSEASSVVFQLALGTGALVLMLIASATLGAYLWVRNGEVRTRLRDFEAEMARSRLEQRFNFLTRFANDIVVLADHSGRVLEANDKAIDTYGYGRDEFVQLNLSDLAAPSERERLERHLAAVREHGSAIYESVHQARDGRRFPVESSTRLIQTVDGENFQDIARDITERKKAELRIERLNEFLRMLGEGNAAIIHLRDPANLLQVACEIATRSGRVAQAWVACRDDRAGELRLVSYSGPAASLNPALFTAIGPSEPAATANLTQRVLNSGAAVYDNNLPPETLSGAAVVRAGAAFPIVVDSVARYVLGVATEQGDVFDKEMIEVLSQLAGDLGYALENARIDQARAEAVSAMRVSEERLMLVIQATEDCYWDLDRKTGSAFVSEGMRQDFGVEPERFGQELQALVQIAHPDDKATLRAMIEDHLAGVAPRLQCEHRAKDRNGRWHWVRLRGRVVERGADGAPLRIAGTYSDVTTYRAWQEELNLWATAFDASREAILITDAEQRIVSVNRAFTEISGYQSSEVLGRTPALLQSGLHNGHFYATLWETLQRQGHWVGEIRDRRKDGESIPLWMSISAARDRDGRITHYVAIATDLSEHEAAQERIQTLAYHDALTGLANRALLQDRIALTLAHARRRSEHAAVLLVDIDYFRNVNDSLGHQVGDAMLQEMARRLLRCVRQDDTVARQGGDEFVLLLSELRSPEDANEVARKVLSEIALPLKLPEAELRATASIGIAVYPEDGNSADALLRNADAALNDAKEQGRNRVRFFVQELNRRAKRRLTIETGLRQAVEDGGFELHYQPQVSARTGAMTSVEALIRWRVGDRLVSPAQFVPVAEETGIIIPMGEWVAAEACRQQRAWQGEGLPVIPVAINVSGSQFRDRVAMQRLLSTLMDGCIDPRLLEIELTEGVLMREAGASVRALKHLKASGLRLAIDDFGTGYSSLSYLRRFPVDRLKVDRSFVRRLPQRTADRAITEAIITLARGLGLAVVAEGVETDAEAVFLREQQCDDLQGYYFSTPLSAPELAGWWRRRAAV